MTGTPPPPPPPPGGMPLGGPPPPVPSAMPPLPPGAPGFGATQHTGTNGMSIASMVLGILSIPMCFLFLPAILAIVFGFVGLGQIKNRSGQSGRGLAITGIILGGIGLLVIVAVIISAGNANFTFDTQTIIR